MTILNGAIWEAEEGFKCELRGTCNVVFMKYRKGL